VKAYPVVRLYGRYGRKVIIACFVSVVLASVGFPQVFAASDALASSSGIDKAAMFILKDVLEVNLSKYHVDVRSTPIGTYLGLPEESVIYTLEYGGETADFIFSFVKGRLRSINAHAAGGLLPLLSVKSECEVAERFLEKYQNYFGALYCEPMRRMLTNVNAYENVTAFSGNIKFTATYGKIKDLDERLVDFSEFRWTYAVDGAEAPLKCVALHFEQGLLRYFVDMWNIYKIENKNVNVSMEEAVKIAVEKAQNISFRVYAGNETWIEVNGFKVMGANWTSLMFTNYPSSVEARGSDPLTLYPLWRVNVYFDRLYPGNIYGASVAIWADTGELCEIQPLYVMGSMFNNEVVQVTPIAGEPPSTSALQQVE
jgi:hypothetical protein